MYMRDPDLPAVTHVLEMKQFSKVAVKCRATSLIANTNAHVSCHRLFIIGSRL